MLEGTNPSPLAYATAAAAPAAALDMFSTCAVPLSTRVSCKSFDLLFAGADEQSVSRFSARQPGTSGTQERAAQTCAGSRFQRGVQLTGVCGLSEMTWATGSVGLRAVALAAMQMGFPRM